MDQDNYYKAKADQGKARWSLIPLSAVRALANVLTFGARKYADHAWRTVPDAKDRYYSAMMRHYSQMVLEPGSIDEESGLPHEDLFFCNAMFLRELFAEDRK